MARATLAERRQGLRRDLLRRPERRWTILGLSELGLDFHLKPKIVSEIFRELGESGFLRVQTALLSGEPGEVGSFIVTRSGKNYLQMMPADTVLSPSELPPDAAFPRKPSKR